MNSLDRLPRLWPTIDLPGIGGRHATYWTVDLDSMPPIAPALDGLAWLLRQPAHSRSLTRATDDPAERDADQLGLQAVAPDLALPPTFRRFIEDPEPRRRVRSATACYLDLGHFSVRLSDGATLVHFLSDQQWVLHWLLYVGGDGAEAVVTTPESLGFDDGETNPIHDLNLETWLGMLAVCADSFEEFLYRYWAMNELFFSLGPDRVPLERLPEELRTYAERYPRYRSNVDIFGARDIPER